LSSQPVLLKRLAGSARSAWLAGAGRGPDVRGSRGQDQLPVLRDAQSVLSPVVLNHELVAPAEELFAPDPTRGRRDRSGGLGTRDGARGAWRPGLHFSER
jgi:hypothetical protein